MTTAGAPSNGQGNPAKPQTARLAYGWIAVISALLLGALIGALTRCGLWCAGPIVRADVLAQHGPAVIGVPTAILIATSVVCGARAIDGEMSLVLPGVEIKGAGAVVVCWLAVFSAVALAIRALW